MHWKEERKQESGCKIVANTVALLITEASGRSASYGPCIKLKNLPKKKKTTKDSVNRIIQLSDGQGFEN